VYPRELSVDPHAEPEVVPLRLILFSDVWKVDVPQAITVVEVDEEVAVPDRDVARHDVSGWTPVAR
jgi:hypothetical protein